MPTDVTDATFQQDVIERSHQVPVVVDLWAPWCGPCRTLGPIIEKVIDETKGQVELVKVNVDENPQVSQAFQVQGIPAVYALKYGEVVVGFVGAHPEGVVREFVGRLAPSAEEQELAALVEAGDEASLRQALERQPDHSPALVALAELLAIDGRSEEALELLAKIPETAETRRIAALARTGAPAEGDGDVSSRLDALLPKVKDDSDARQEYLDLLEVLGPDDPRTREYRKQLTAQLF